MPIYEYRCSSCGAEHEALQKLSDPLLVTCPSCHKDTLVKQVSAAGFQLKGSGWYVTDFRNGSKPAGKNDAKADAASPGESAPKDGEGKKDGEAKKDSAPSAPAKSESSTPASTTPAPSKPASSE